MRQALLTPLFVNCVLAFAAFADTDLVPKDETRYTKQWAIVIGINYDGRHDIERFGIQKLAHAESDANAVAKVLETYYGYVEGQTLVLLTGEKATKRNIERQFGNHFLADEKKVGPNDSVLVFFAGHGSRERDKRLSETLVYPQDVEGLEEGGIDDTSCVAMTTLVKHLENCRARHKLVILDSCHSGELFQLQSSRSGSEINPKLFKQPALRAITAAAGDETASDGGDGHSPFAQALLNSLTTEIRLNQFSDSVLYNAISIDVKRQTKDQTPLHGALTRDPGEFYFFRAAPLSASIDESRLNEALTLQTLPGLSGRWWFDETPWLTPSLRMRGTILDGLPVLHTALRSQGSVQGRNLPTHFLEGADVAKIRESLRELVQSYRNDFKNCPHGESELLGTLLGMSTTLNQSEAEWLLNKVENCDDLHLKAAVHHWLNRGKPDALYSNAIEAYIEKNKRGTGQKGLEITGLLRLCYSDRARYLLATGRVLEALADIDNALAVKTGEESSILFDIDNRLLLARIQTVRGEWEKADNALAQALDIAAKSLPEGHPLLPAVYDQLAWTNMDRWHINDAAKYFGQALELRQNMEVGDLEVRIRMLHNEHGLAMVDRFSGRIDLAQSRYARLADEVKELIPDIKSRAAHEMVHGRLVNTLERLADCQLFASPPQPKRALEAIKIAIRLCSELPASSQPLTEARLLCKEAMARAISDDPERAAAILTAVKQSEYKQLVGNQSQQLDFFWRTADALTQLQLDPSEGRHSLRGLLESPLGLSKEAAARREQWEVLLFAADLLVRSHDLAIESTEAVQDAELLLRLASGQLLNRSNLLYVRPYMDTGMRALFANVSHVEASDIADAVLRATTGEHLASVDRNQSAVVFYLSDSDGYAMVLPSLTDDGPVSSEIVPLGFGRSTLQAAALPERLIKSVKQMTLPVNVVWMDAGIAPVRTNEQFPFTNVADWTPAPTAAIP